MSASALHATEENVRNAENRRKQATRIIKIALLVVPLALLAVGGVWLVDRLGVFAAQCDVSELQAAAVADDKVAAGLAGIADACLTRGLEEGDGDAMVAGIAGLRVAAEETGSAEAALRLAQLYDPNLREELLATSSSSALIPDADAREAVRFYDLAAKNGDGNAKTMASVLRKAFNIPEAGSVVGGGRLPILRDDGTGLYRRVLLKPGGVLMDKRPAVLDGNAASKAKQARAGVPGEEADDAEEEAPEAESDALAEVKEAVLGEPTRALDIQYVFTEEDGWLSIARRVNATKAARKWIRVEDTVEWDSMLGLRYREPNGQGKVVFFENLVAASNAIRRHDLPEFHEFLTTSASEEDLGEAGVIALQDNSYPWGQSSYVMPITDFRQVERDGQVLTLVRVGSIAGWSNADAAIPDEISKSGARKERVRTVKLAPASGQQKCASDQSQDLRHQIVFVIDTTISMGPYIDGVKRIAARWKTEIERRGLEGKFRFGVVGYRNNMDEAPQAGRLEYVRRSYLTPGAHATAVNFAQKVQALRPASVSTHDFNEDVAAGLDEALSFDWASECGIKQIYLITDAGALADTDPKGMLYNRSTGLFNLRERAKADKVRIDVVHIQTPEARAAGNLGSAKETYEELSPGRYTYIRDGSREQFDAYLEGVGKLIELIEREARGELIDRSETFANPTLPSQQVLNDLFAVQQTFVGQLSGTEVPVFVDLWTSDRDLADINKSALEIGVMLTRGQLSQLAEQIDLLIDGVKAERHESGSFFKMLQIISAGTSSDPIAVTMQGADEIALGNRLPSWLERLPYQSQVLALDAADWRSMSETQQSRLLNFLEQQSRNYKDREADSGQWISFEGQDRALDVTFIPLEWMP